MKLRTKSGFILTAVMLMLTAFSVTAFANAKVTPTPTPTPTEELSVNDNTESKTPLSPKGNMTSIDDVHQITDTSDKNTIEDKQFITVESKNGNVFYIIIDRSGDTDNVYFLNAVDESDLMALLEDEQKAEITAVCTCTDKCELGDVDENCPICSKNISKCIGKESVQDDKDKDKDTKEETKQSGSPFAGLLILAILGAGGALYWFKFKNKKSSTKGTTEPEEYYEDDESEVDEETEENEETEVITDDEEYDDNIRESEDDEE